MSLVEEWRDVVGYEGLYQISNLGQVRNVKTGKIRAQQNGDGGYKFVILHDSKGGRRPLTKGIHRLMAEAFIPNPDNKPCVNHKDENTSNNTLDNLEWVTYQENNVYGTRLERAAEAEFDKGKTVYRFTKSGELIDSFPSLSTAARFLGVHVAHISHCCLGERKSAYGYKWSFELYLT